MLPGKNNCKGLWLLKPQDIRRLPAGHRAPAPSAELLRWRGAWEQQISAICQGVWLPLKDVVQILSWQHTSDTAVKLRISGILRIMIQDVLLPVWPWHSCIFYRHPTSRIWAFELCSLYLPLLPNGRFHLRLFSTGKHVGLLASLFGPHFLLPISLELGLKRIHWFNCISMCTVLDSSLAQFMALFLILSWFSPK